MDELINTVEIADYFGISVKLLYQRIRRFYKNWPDPVKKVGWYQYYNREQMMAYIAANPYKRKNGSESERLRAQEILDILGIKTTNSRAYFANMRKRKDPRIAGLPEPLFRDALGLCYDRYIVLKILEPHRVERIEKPSFFDVMTGSYDTPFKQYQDKRTKERAAKRKPKTKTVRFIGDF